VRFTAKKATLAGVAVREAMRSEVVSLPTGSPLHKAIRQLTKYKIGALLVTQESDLPVGVASKTDIVGAYYAGLPVDSPLEHIMVSPPIYCRSDESLESALETMRSSGVYRLYVLEDAAERVIGVLAYPDIVGLLYRFCRKCEQGLATRRKARGLDEQMTRVRVREVMTPSVVSYPKDATLTEIMEGLSAYRFGAVLIVDDAGQPCGVVSKTDLILAYARGQSAEEPARSILGSGRVITCGQEEFLEDTIRTMVFSEVHRVFVHDGDPQSIVGVFSLSDAAGVLWGSCRACVTSRIRVEADA
jgi:CBS domain-containing protein